MTTDYALSRCMKICSTKEYAPSEIFKKLIEWGIVDVAAGKIIATLKQDKFLDEFRYAKYYTNDKIRFNKWGKTKIRLMLRSKEIPMEAIDAALAQISTDEYIDIVCKELKKKRKTIKNSDPYIIRGKLFQFAAGRGVEPEVIHRLIDKIIKE
jgi:regulatory protein